MRLNPLFNVKVPLWMMFILFAPSLVIGASPARAMDLNIQTEAHYEQLKSGIRAAEYTRQNYLESTDNPRAIVATVGLWAFAERNPQATPEQLFAYVTDLDSALAASVIGDPELTGFGSIITAAKAARVASDGALAGMDTRINRRLLELLGLDLPGVSNFQQSRQRMTRFDIASVQRLIQRRETMDALTAVLAGVTPDGRRPQQLGPVAAAYLTAQGLDPRLGSIDPNETEINAGLSNLPSFAEFIAIRDTPGEHVLLEQQTFEDIDRIQQQGTQLLESIGTPEPRLGLFLDSASLFVAANDPSDPNHAAAVAELEARRQALIESNRETATERAAVFARTLILQQSSFESVRAIATTARDYTSIQLQTNNTLATVTQSIELGGAVIGFVAAVYTGDAWGAAQSATDVITKSIGLADTLGIIESPPSIEEQMFDQLVELRVQVEDMRIQLNQRFDVVDTKLNQLYSTMTQSFQAIGFQIGDLQEDVEELSAAIAESRSALDRIEDALFGFAQEILLADLSQETNIVLNYFDNNGIALPYAGGTPSFVASSSFFYTFSTTTAKGQSFAGTPDDQPVAVTLENAADTLGSGDIAIARRLNDLRRVPDGLLDGDGAPIGPLVSGRVAAPAPWAQGAAAFLQLAEENPWYFNYQLTTQINSGGTPRIDDLIDDGERIVALANAVRTSPVLFDALLDRASAGAAQFQAAVGQQLDQQLIPAGLSNGTTRIDAWGLPGQTVSPLINADLVVNVSDTGGPRSPLALDASAFLHQGHEITLADEIIGLPAGVTRSEAAERNALSHIFTAGSAASPQFDLRVGSSAWGSGPNGRRFAFELGTDGRFAVEAKRQVLVELEWRRFGGWEMAEVRPLGTNPVDLIPRAWPALGPALAAGNLEEETFSTGLLLFNVPFPAGIETRLKVTADSSSTVDYNLQTDFLADELSALRQTLRPAFLAALDTPGSDVGQAARRLNNDAALIDAYLTIGMADALSRSELLRSAARGAPGIAGLGFRSADVDALVVHDSLADTGELGGVAGAELSRMDEILGERIAALRIEIDSASATDAPSFPYVEFILAELRALREQAPLLAIDETYAGDGAVAVDAEQGLLKNDIGQNGEIDQQELGVDLDFFTSPAAIQPANGSVVVAADGSFTYTPDPGFNGIDRFSYRLVSDIPGVGQRAVSEPADVVIRVGDFDDRIFSNGFEVGF